MESRSLLSLRDISHYCQHVDREHGIGFQAGEEEQSFLCCSFLASSTPPSRLGQACLDHSGLPLLPVMDPQVNCVSFRPSSMTSKEVPASHYSLGLEG